jgi:hypothetical protein
LRCRATSRICLSTKIVEHCLIRVIWGKNGIHSGDNMHPMFCGHNMEQ